MLSRVSLNMSMLALMITREMMTPNIPSRDMWKNIDMIAATNVERDSIASKNASLPDATNACELILSPTPFTYLPKRILTMTATAMIISETVVYDVTSGLNIFGQDSISAVIPAHRTIAAMITDEKYSIRPYPYGWSLSGAFPASFVPIIVIIDDNASVRLFTASSVIAIEFTSIPIVALNATRIRLTTIPIMLVLTIVSCLVIIMNIIYGINKFL